VALNALAVDRLLDVLRPGQAIAALGYPDIIYPPEDLAKKLGPRLSGLTYREESSRICKRHGLQYRQIPDAERLFELYGCSLDVYDIRAERGCEIVLDLNQPFPANACEQYDYVLDVGTIEHCFNIAQALVNAAALVKVGGVIFHENPFNRGNHGFYGINPTLFHDFYTDNGFEVIECRLIDDESASVAIHPTRRFIFTDKEINVFLIAKRLEARDFVFPTQSKYRPKDKRGESPGQDR
jgi:SAM-dependent methyltransferase